MEEIINNINKQQIVNYSKILSKLSPIEFVSLGYIISLTLIEILNPNEQNTIGNLLELIGQTLLTSYAQSSVINPNYNSVSTNQYNKLKFEVELIKKDILKLNRNQR